MPDLKSMSTFEKYVTGLSLLTPEQLQSCKKVQQGLRELGVSKSLEELCVRLGVLDADRLGALLTDIKAKWGISVPRPVLYEISEENDRALQEQLVQQSSKGASQVLECREIAEKSKGLGLQMTVAEALIAKGYFRPPTSAKMPTPPPSAAPAPASKPAVAAEAAPVKAGDPELDNLLPDAPMVKKAPVPVAPPQPLAPRKLSAASAKPGPGRPARGTPREKDEAPAPAKKNTKMTFWIGIGAAAAIFLVVIILLVASPSKTPAPPPERESEKPVAKVAKKPAPPAEKAPEPKGPTPEAAKPEPTSRPSELKVEPGSALATLPKGLKESEPAALAPEPKPERDPAPAKPEEKPEPAIQESSGPVGYWSFDEGQGISAADGSGSSGKATLNGVTWLPGKVGSSLSFNGTSSSARVSRTAAMEKPAISVALWVKRSGSQGTWASVLRKTFRNNSGPTWSSWSLQFSPSDGAADMISFNTGSEGANHHLRSSGVIPDGTWVHVVAVYDPAGPAPQKRLYINGRLDAEAKISLPIAYDASPTGDLWLGQSSADKEFFKGQADELRIYGRALGETEVRELAGTDTGLAQNPDPAPAPDKPAGDKPAPKPAPKGGKAGPAPDPKREEREKKAEALWEAAEKLEKDNKFAEAQDKLRELRSRYRSTRLYWDKMIEITDKINDLGQKIASAEIVKTTFYKRPHMDGWWAFEFLPPQGWKGVPVQPLMVGEQDNDEQFYKGRTYQMARYNAPYLDKLYIVVLKTFACSGLDNLESKVTGELEERYKGLKEESKTTLQGKMPYVKKTYVSNDGDRVAAYYFYGDKKGFALCGIWRAGGDGMYISITTITSEGRSTRKTSNHPVSESDFAAAMKVFDQSAKTFWIYDAGARAGKRQELGIGGSLCSDWSVLKSSKGNYTIMYATRKDFAQRAGEEMEQIQALYRHIIPTQKNIPPCLVKMFDREEDFKDYCGMMGAAAYWSPMQEEIVGYRFEGDKLKLDSKEEFTLSEEKNPEDVTFKVLYHEGFHQYMYFYMGRARNVYVPSWLNEGMGDYFFGGDWNKGHSKFTIGINDWRIKTIATAVKKNEHVPLEKIFHYTQQDYYRKAGLCYAEGWSINYFFQMSDVAKKKGYNLIPQKMMEGLKASGNWEKATDTAFAGIDIKKMEEEWKEFVLGLPIPKDAKGADMDPDDPFGDK